MTIQCDDGVSAVLVFSVVHAPLDGLRWSDLDKLEQLKQMFKPTGLPHEVEVAADLVPLLKASFNAAPAGRLPRYDEVPKALAYLRPLMEG